MCHGSFIGIFGCKESSRPVPNNGDTESIRWTLNQTDRELECNFLGTPVPQIQWSKDDKVSIYLTILTFELIIIDMIA